MRANTPPPFSLSASREDDIQGLRANAHPLSASARRRKTTFKHCKRTRTPFAPQRVADRGRPSTANEHTRLHRDERLGLSGSRLDWGSFRAASMSLHFVFLTSFRKVLSDHPSTILSGMDIPGRNTMKGTAKCERHSDLQDCVSRSAFECILRLREGLQARLLQCLYTNGRRLLASLRVSRHESSQLSGCVLCVFRGVSGAARPLAPIRQPAPLFLLSALRPSLY